MEIDDYLQSKDIEMNRIGFQLLKQEQSMDNDQKNLKLISYSIYVSKENGKHFKKGYYYKATKNDFTEFEEIGTLLP